MIAFVIILTLQCQRCAPHTFIQGSCRISSADILFAGLNSSMYSASKRAPSDTSPETGKLIRLSLTISMNRVSHFLSWPYNLTKCKRIARYSRYKITPTLHTSHWALYPRLAFKTSGAALLGYMIKPIYRGVPTRFSIISHLSTKVASPKSATRISIFSSVSSDAIRMFSGLMSRWTIPHLWRYADH